MTVSEPSLPLGKPEPDLQLDLDLVVEAEPPADLDLNALRALVPFVLRAEGADGPWTIAVALVGDERLRALHRDFMGLDTPTDVITFPAHDPESATDARGGDVVVSVDRAAEQAPDYDHTPADEIRFLVVHGLLHLCGWDDRSPTDRTRMLARQAALLAAFDETRRANPTA